MTLTELVLKNIKEATKDNKELTEDIVKEVVEKIQASGDFVPESKYKEALSKEKELEKVKDELNKAQDNLKKFEGVDVKASDELAKLKEEIANQKKELESKKIEDAKVAKESKILEAIEKKLESDGAISPNLISKKILEKVGGIEKISLTESGEFNKDIDYAFNDFKVENPKQFSSDKVKSDEQGGNTIETPTTWTKENAREHLEKISDEEAQTLANSDEKFAEATGLTSLVNKTE